MLSGDQITKILNPAQVIQPQQANGITETVISVATNNNATNISSISISNIKEGNIFKSQEYEKACEYFGLSHPVVQKHNKFLSHYLKKIGFDSNTEKQMLDNYIDLLELRKPYKITRNFYICKIGSPFFTEPKESMVPAKHIDFYDGFVSFRQYASFLTPEVLVYFYQTVIYVKEIEQMVFAIVPEDNEDLVLFHTDPEKLMAFIFKKIELMTSQVKHFFKFKKQSKRYNFPSVYTALLKQKILNYYKADSNFDSLLEKLYDIGIGKQRLDSDTNLLGQATEIAINENLGEILQAIFNQKVRDWGLDIQMDLGEFFFGMKHPKVTALTNVAR